MTHRNRAALELHLKALGYSILDSLEQASFDGQSFEVVCVDGRRRVCIAVGLGEWTDCYRIVGGEEPKRPPATVNQRMLAELEREPQRIDWSARKWASVLGCGVASVQRSPAWKRILAARALSRAERSGRNAEREDA